MESFNLLLLLGILGLLFQISEAHTKPLNELSHSYKIRKTWDNREPSDGAEITMEFLQAKGRETEGFVIKVEAPFYDDPQLPEGTSPGCYEGLWDFEVVEVFFLGLDEKYLEIELGPKGNYLVYYLEGIRNVTNPALFLEEYVANLTQNDARWEGEAFVPWDFLPPDVGKFNAYAIHKSDPDRVYMSLFPVPEGAYPGPNFHLLEPFGDIDLSDLVGDEDSTTVRNSEGTTSGTTDGTTSGTTDGTTAGHTESWTTIKSTTLGNGEDTRPTGVDTESTTFGDNSALMYSGNIYSLLSIILFSYLYLY